MTMPPSAPGELRAAQRIARLMILFAAFSFLAVAGFAVTLTAGMHHLLSYWWALVPGGAAVAAGITYRRYQRVARRAHRAGAPGGG